jgi:hypothetical protein
MNKAKFGVLQKEVYKVVCNITSAYLDLAQTAVPIESLEWFRENYKKTHSCTSFFVTLSLRP